MLDAEFRAEQVELVSSAGAALAQAEQAGNSTDGAPAEAPSEQGKG